MTAKEYLMRPLNANKKLELAIEQLARLRAISEKATSTIKDAPSSTLEEGSRMENATLEVIEQQKVVASAFDKFIELQKEVSAAIDKLPDINEQLVLGYRYVCCKEWRDVATSIGLGEARVYKIHKSALKNFSPIAAEIQ